MVNFVHFISVDDFVPPFSCFLEQNSYLCTQNEQNKQYEKDLWIDGGAAVRGDPDGCFDPLSTSTDAY